MTPLITGYDVKTETLLVAGASMQVRSLLDRQQFHDPDGEAERIGVSSATWPLFGMTWPSSLVLASYLLGTSLEGRRVLEVGCGLALASLSLHRRHGDVTASDHHPLAGEFLRENLKLNDLPDMPYRHGDWAADDAGFGRFDLIIGSDVLYERGHPALLAAFIQRHATPTAEVVLVDPDRGNRPAFTRAMGANGFTLEETRIAQVPGSDTPYKGRVLRYTRTAASAAPPTST